MCACSPAASGVARAIEELGLKGKVFVAGTGTKTESLVGLENGTISGILRWNPAGAGYAMCSLAYKILSGEEITEGVDLDYTGYNSMVMEDKVLLGDDQVVITPGKYWMILSFRVNGLVRPAKGAGTLKL